MELNVPELEQRLLNLQWQVERLWQMAEGSVQPLEQRLVAMADQYADHLKRWGVYAERQAQAVAQLESYVNEWKDATARQQDTFQRIRDLETTIQTEWETLKKIHEEPVRELREQAAGLTEVCIATANVAQQELDRHEARLATFQNDIHRRLSEFGRDLQSAIAEIRTRTDNASRLDPAATPWSLDDVLRLHGQIRDPGGLRLGAGGGRSLDQAGDRPALPPAIAAKLEELRRTRNDSAPPSVVDTSADISEPEPAPAPPADSRWRGAVLGLSVVAVLLAVAFGWQQWSALQVATDRLQNAELESQKAVEAARLASVAREESEREISGAREVANRAARISDVLAAPDLVRINLFGGTGAPGASGQALWSRTRGIVFSGSRIPPAPANGTHQLWLLTRMEPVRATEFVPEADGTVTLVGEAPNVPRPVVGMMVTTGPGDYPSGDPILTSINPPSAQ